MRTGWRPGLFAGLAVATVGVALAAPAPVGTSARATERPPVTRSVGVATADDSYRARAESWVATRAYPALFGRAGSPSDAAFWAGQSVRSSPGSVASRLGRTTEARRHQVSLAYEVGLDRPASPDDRRYWAEQLGSGWSNDRLVSHLLGSAETLNRHGTGTQWVRWVYSRLLGRTGSTAEHETWAQRLASGQTHDWVARQIGGTGEARSHVVRATYTEVRGPVPSAGELSSGVGVLRGSSGDVMALRAAVLTPLAPSGYRVGVVGDSVAFDLEFGSRGQPLPAVVSDAGRPVPGNRVACGVLSARSGYQWPGDDVLVQPTGAEWGAPGDGRCVEQVAVREDAMLDQRPELVLWPIGAWEWTPVRRPDGVVIPARSTAMRGALVLEMARRIDRWAARGVQRVVLMEWACVGLAAPTLLRSPGFVGFVRSVLDAVVAQRPGQAIVARAPPEVCVDGDPAGSPTGAHRMARGDAYHWLRGAHGAAWGWTWWVAPAIAGLSGLTS